MSKTIEEQVSEYKLRMAQPHERGWYMTVTPPGGDAPIRVWVTD